MPHALQQTSTPAADPSASDLTAQIRAQVNQQLKQAGVSKSDAAQQAKNITIDEGKGVTVITKNGKTITIHTPVVPAIPPIPAIPGVASQGPVTIESGTTVPSDPPLDIPQRVENLGYALFLMIAIIAVGKPLARAFGNIVERRAIKPAMPAGIRCASRAHRTGNRVHVDRGRAHLRVAALPAEGAGRRAATSRDPAERQLTDGFGQSYYDRWYRHLRHRVSTPAERARIARTIIATAEQLLERRVRNALDVGCGEGLWRAALRRERPHLDYLGIEPSAYAVRRFGARRNIVQGDIATLSAPRIRGRFDIIICNDVLHYLEAPVLRSGMRALVDRLRGVAYLGLFTSADDIEGDLDGFKKRTPSFYRRAFEQAGLRAIGMHCWIPEPLARDRAALELSDA